MGVLGVVMKDTDADFEVKRRVGSGQVEWGMGGCAWESGPEVRGEKGTVLLLEGR